MWPAIIPGVMSLLERVLPDPKAAEEAKIRLLELASKQDESVLGFAEKMSTIQGEVNKAEAGSGDKFAARWRPSIGFVIAAALAFQYVLNPLLLWVVAIMGMEVTPPNIQMDGVLAELMFGMLGLAGWRTLDKIKGRG